MPQSHKKNTIIVTGANGIIGFKVCEKALAEGANVAAFDVHTDQLEILKNKHDEKLIIHSCDLRLKEDIQTGLDKVLDKWGSVDGLHNNAAWKGGDTNEFFKAFEEYSLDTWRDILSVNLDGVMLVDQVIGSYMASHQKSGAIVHTASIYGIQAPDQRIYEGSNYLGGSINTPAVYSASKGAVISLTKYLATYWADKGVRVNCITPGGVESGQNEIFKRKYSDRVPLGRMAQAKEIADGVMFLLSQRSSYITGHNLIVDGGFSIW